jgi:predicted ribonuclease YlaK
VGGRMAEEVVQEVIKYIVDTNVFFENIEDIKEYNIVALSHVYRELDVFKSRKSRISNMDEINKMALLARIAVRYLADPENQHKITRDLKDYKWTLNTTQDGSYVDNLIIQAAVENGYGVISNDQLVIEKCRGYNIPYITFGLIDSEDSKATYDSMYTGVREVVVNEEELAYFYENIQDNIYDLHQNEYLMLKDEKGQYIDKAKFRWNGQEYVAVKWRNSESRHMGKAKPRNLKQELLFNMLQDKSITVKAVFGKFGSGKDFCMISHAIEMLEKRQIDKIVFVRNQIPLKDSPESGFRKGDNFDKMIEYAMPLADAVGGVDQLRLMVDAGIVELQDLSRVRGRDIKNAIIYVTEVQNNTSEHVKLLISRVGEGSQIWFNGDLKQTDKDVFRHNSGILTLTKLKGNPLYGQVVLDKTERSITASLVELL